MNDDTWFNVKEHFDAVLEGMCAEYHPLDEYETYILETMAGFGDPYAAEILAEAYEHGEAMDSAEEEPIEVLRWSLIQQFLEGDESWFLLAEDKQNEIINEQDKRLVLEDVRKWIKKHPIARSRVYCELKRIPRQVFYFSSRDDV